MFLISSRQIHDGQPVPPTYAEGAASYSHSQSRANVAARRRLGVSDESLLSLTVGLPNTCRYQSPRGGPIDRWRHLGYGRSRKLYRQGLRLVFTIMTNAEMRIIIVIAIRIRLASLSSASS
jgi:hypothetical protein